MIIIANILEAAGLMAFAIAKGFDIMAETFYTIGSAHFDVADKMVDDELV